MDTRSLVTVWRIGRRIGVLMCWLGLYALLFPVASLAENSDQTEQISGWIQEADEYMEQGELTAAYDVYLRVAGVEPANTHARTQIFAILREYKTRVLSASDQEEDARYRELHIQRYRLGVRDLLHVLTTQLKQHIERYGEQVAALKSGQDVVSEIPPLLVNIILILNDITAVYEEFSQSDADAAGTQKIVDRLKQTVAKYEQELDFYSQNVDVASP